jgi:ribosome biogenesis protein MAK21
MGQAASLKKQIEDKKTSSGRKHSSKKAGGGKGGSGGKAAAPPPQAGMGELDARMLSALITGVRRAFPYVEASEVEPLVEAHGEALFKLVHTAPFTVALQALLLLFQLLSGRWGRAGGGLGARGVADGSW